MFLVAALSKTLPIIYPTVIIATLPMVILLGVFSRARWSACGACVLCSDLWTRKHDDFLLVAHDLFRARCILRVSWEVRARCCLPALRPTSHDLPTIPPPRRQSRLPVAKSACPKLVALPLNVLIECLLLYNFLPFPPTRANTPGLINIHTYTYIPRSSFRRIPSSPTRQVASLPPSQFPSPNQSVILLIVVPCAFFFATIQFRPPIPHLHMHFHRVLPMDIQRSTFLPAPPPPLTLPPSPPLASQTSSVLAYVLSFLSLFFSLSGWASSLLASAFTCLSGSLSRSALLTHSFLFYFQRLYANSSRAVQARSFLGWLPCSSAVGRSAWFLVHRRTFRASFMADRHLGVWARVTIAALIWGQERPCSPACVLRGYMYSERPRTVCNHGHFYLFRFATANMFFFSLFSSLISFHSRSSAFRL